jgi:Flp pilus assembly protein TadD
VVSVDIFALTNEATGERLSALANNAANRADWRQGGEVTAEVVIANRLAAHSFAPEVRDLYEIWVEFEAQDAAGKTVFHSGFIKPDKHLDESAHIYKAILLDEEARPVTRHQIWRANVKAYDNAIQAGRSDVARFRFRLPPGPFTLRARVNYRRFNQEYTEYVLGRQRRAFGLPVARMAETTLKLAPAAPPICDEPADKLARRWHDYGIGLMEQAQYGPAAAAFRRAAELAPDDPNPLVSAAVAELRTERYGPELAQLNKAKELLERALQFAPGDARARFFQALLLRSRREANAAAAELATLAREYPRDRQVWRELGATLYALGRLDEARNAFGNVRDLDPTDAGAYQFLAPLYQGLGRRDEAAYAREKYLQWREDPLADSLAARFFARQPAWADERVAAHTHGANAAPRPTLTGAQAAPVK